MNNKGNEIILPGIAANMLPHHIDNSSSDEGIFDNEGVKIRCRVSHDRTHDWVPSTNCCVIDIGDQRSRVQIIK